MIRHLSGVFIALVLATVVPAAFAQAPLASGFGETNIGGQRAFVHVTVAVPPGQSRAAAVADAIRGMGARPVDSDAFSLTGMHWSGRSSGNFPSGLTQNYSTAMSVDEVTALLNSQSTWNDVDSSVFGFSNGGSTNRCPSLARECPGPQYTDGFNDVQFISIGGCCTLAATWYVTSGAPEADMVINDRFNWGNTYDLETVILHENGHALGLGHSQVSDAVMVATYAGERRTLATDDARGVTYLYPAVGAIGSVGGRVTNTSGQAIGGASVSIPNLPGGTATTAGNGDYVIARVPIVGTEPYAISAGAEGYQSQSTTVVISGEATQNFALSGGGGGTGGDSGGSGGCKRGGKKAC